MSDIIAGQVDLSERNIFGTDMTASNAYLAPLECSDCRVHGVLEKPDYWE